MSIKAELINNPRLHLIEGDLTDSSSIIDKLKRADWLQYRPNFLIMEGVSRYLTPDNLKNFVPAIKPHNAFSTIRGKVA
jgi:O-methyltransferase involved in polyketide biosynthesis